MTTSPNPESKVTSDRTSKYINLAQKHRTSLIAVAATACVSSLISFGIVSGKNTQINSLNHDLNTEKNAHAQTKTQLNTASQKNTKLHQSLVSNQMYTNAAVRNAEREATNPRNPVYQGLVANGEDIALPGPMIINGNLPEAIKNIQDAGNIALCNVDGIVAFSFNHANNNGRVIYIAMDPGDEQVAQDPVKRSKLQENFFNALNTNAVYNDTKTYPSVWYKSVYNTGHTSHTIEQSTDQGKTWASVTTANSTSTFSLQ